MVFETIVVDVLNRFLGDYVENLNRSQLKLGIWGGDVVLENLKLKQNALEELNIPVTTVYGHLGKLVLKIPWKNLYGESVEATIERLFLIVNPNAEVTYDHEKEQKMAFAAKQAELARVEEAKRREEAKDENKLDETFVEKLVTQIIKNVQLKIKDIHIRYEDSITNPKAPFSFGITLHDLSVHTTDQDWNKTVIQEAVTKIFKILYLDGLAVYWNPITQLYSKEEEVDIQRRLQAEIGTATIKPEFYQYALGPINATAKLKLNPKPEGDRPRFSIPKVILTLHMAELSVSLNKAQYQDMMLLADSMDRMNKAAPYRKYRPNLKMYRGHYKEWWQFAYTCILQEEVKRRRRNWDWNHMLEHRKLCRDYANAYKYKLSNKGKLSAYHQGIIYKAEKNLDVFNLVVIRQKIEMEVARVDKLEEEAKKARGVGWFRGWWGESDPKDGGPSEGTDIMRQFEKAMTPDEKLKLFRAIDYQENSAPLHLPGEYVAVKSIFTLSHMQVSIKDGEKEVLRACVNNVRLEMRQRPSANAIRVEVRMKSFTVTGVEQGIYEPQLVQSIEASKDDHLLNVIFETNPINSRSNQRVKVTALPLQIIYDAQTVIEIVNVFKPPIETPALATLQSAAENKLLDLKEKSALGMQYAVQIHTFVDVNIDVAASYIIIPQTGIYRDDESCVVVKLGAISVKSEPRLESVNIHQLFKEGKAEDEIYRELTKQSYDKLTLRLTEMQIVISMAQRNDDWRAAIKSNEPTPLHLLQPTNLLIQIHKCLIADDPRFPKFKIKGQLDRLAITASEDRLLTLCEILLSMPLPQSEETTQLKTSESRASSLSLLKYLDPAEKQRRDSTKAKDKAKEAGTVQITEVEAFFIMKKLVLSVNRKATDPDDECNKFLVFSLNDLELTAIQKTFTFEAAIRLRAVEMQHYRQGFDVIDVLGTPEVHLAKAQKRNAFGDQYLFTVVYRNVDKNWSEFFCSYECVEQLIELDITTLRVLLHAEGLKQILFVVNEYQARLQSIQRTVDRVANAGHLETIAEHEELTSGQNKSKVRKAKPKQDVHESTQLKVKGKIEKIEIEFANNDRPLSLVTLEGATTSIVMKTAIYTQIDCTVAKFLVEDLNPVTIHKEVLKVLGGDVINAQIVIYYLPDDYQPRCSDVDMSVHAQINCLRVVCLNWYYMSMAEFFNNFQNAQQALLDASTQAADVARANVQEVYENSTKIRLKIKLAAPIIIIPENSTSYNALLIDLGRMSIDNKFVELDISENESDKKVTVDELTLELEDMKASCVMLSPDLRQDLAYEREVLRPTTFSLYVKRSLSPWYEPLPDLDVSGRFMSITITIGHSDYKSIMKILNENIQEGKMNVYGVKTRPLVSKNTSKATVKSQTSRANKSNLAALSHTEPKKPRVSIKFSFIMDRFVIDLLNTVGTGKFLRGSNDVEFARLCLALFAVRGKIYSDNSIQVSVLLVDCTLDDMRPGRGTKITRYLARRRDSKTPDEKSPDDKSKDDKSQDKKSPDKKSPDKKSPDEKSPEELSKEIEKQPEDSLMETSTKIRSMIDISYTMNETDTYLDMKISSFNLILVSDFLNKIVEFLSPGVEDDVVMEKLKVKVVKSPFQKAESMTKKKMSVASTAVVNEQPKPKPHNLNVNIKVEQVNIIFVETLEQKKSDALVLNMEGRLKLRKSEERCIADGAIYGLQVGIQTIGDEGPESDAQPRYLLAPTHLSVVMSQPVGSGMRIDVTLTNIKITLSPGVMALLKRVLATIFSSEDDNVQNENMTIYYDQLWDIQRLRIHLFWFLKTERAREAIDVLGEGSGDNEEDEEDAPPPLKGEICIISCPSIVVAYEMDIGESTIPILVMEASLTGLARDWSSHLRLETTLATQVSYYNIKRALWEPLVEPIEVLRDGQYKHVPWELKMELKIKKQGKQPAIDTTDEAKNLQAIALRQANRTITLSSYDPLEITITNSGLEVITQFIDSFMSASATTIVSNLLEDKSQKKYFGAPYVLHNATGLTLKLKLEDNDDFTVVLTDEFNPKRYLEVEIKPDASVPLQLKHGELNLVKLNEALPPLKLTVRIEELDDQIQIPMERADKRYFPVGRRLRTGSGAGEGLGVSSSANIIFPLPHDANVEPRGLVSEVIMQDAAMHIYLCSILQITNTLAVDLNVYYMKLSGNEVELIDVVKPNAVLRLPLKAVHTHTAEIFFSVDGFTVSDTPFMWRELQQDIKIKKLLQCDSKDLLTGEKFYLKVIGSMEQVFNEYSNRYTLGSSCFHLEVKPSVKLQNCLPYPIIVSQLGLSRQITFQPGEMIQLSHLVPNWASIVVMIENYLEKCWVCTKSLPDYETELSVWSFTSHDSPTVMTLELGMFSVDMEGTQVLSLYCPFWMLNKTGFTLCYRKEDTNNVIFHEKENKEPILFSYQAKNFFGKKKAAIRIEFGEWSDRFSLDVPGSSGFVVCKHEKMTYQVAVTNQLTFNSLTKMVIFSPYFLIINEAPFAIQYQEYDRPADPWQMVNDNSSAPLWPVVEKEDKMLILRVSCSTEHTAPFLYTEQNTTCLKLLNEYGGIHVEVQLTEGGTYITLRQYREGDAPALIINYTDLPVTIYEKQLGKGVKEKLNYNEIPAVKRLLFTWDRPAGPRILVFAGHKPKETEIDLRKDGIGDVMLTETVKITWVSFLDGLQRTVLFTDDPILAKGAYSIGEAEMVDTEYLLSMQGLGLSLVNDIELSEIIYVSISNSDVIWEECKIGSRRYKKADASKIIKLEEGYQKYLKDKIVCDDPMSPRVMIDKKIEVDFEEMRITKPSPRLLRRVDLPGLWVSYGICAHTRQIHAKLNRLQIDQQLPMPTFPVILAPVALPRSVVSDDEYGQKPFIEISIVERIMEHSKVRQYKYYKMLMQEFQVKLDMGLINAVLEMFPQKVLSEQEALEAFLVDLEKARQPLEALAAMGVATELKHFYDNLHLSPLKLHVSFSLGSATHLPTFIGALLQSIGVTLTDMNDVIFKLSYYERNYEFLSNREFMNQVKSHYTGQALKQLYVLVLGLDVIGNPYGLVLGLKKGVHDLFYEPIQGAIQGPGEFAEGLFLGVRSLVGHTVGGAAGAVSRITGAMGHGIAALSLDKEYQRRRRDNINKTPANLHEGLARSGKGLVMGVVDGVTGVFTQPFEGARDEGVEGFFKGLGRGAVGIVARPASGVVDFAAGSLDAVRRWYQGVVEGVSGVIVQPVKGAQQAGAVGFVKGLGRGAIGLVVRPVGGVVDFASGLLNSVIRATDLSEDVTKRRPTRYLPPDSGVRPYSRLRAEGFKMLTELEKGKFLATDTYEAHVWVLANKEVVLCTDKRLLYLEKNNVFGGWQIVWTYQWVELTGTPKIVNKGVYLPTPRRKMLGVFPSSSAGKVILLYDEQQRRFLLNECLRLMKR